MTSIETKHTLKNNDPNDHASPGNVSPGHVNPRNVSTGHVSANHVGPSLMCSWCTNPQISRKSLFAPADFLLIEKFKHNEICSKSYSYSNFPKKLHWFDYLSSACWITHIIITWDVGNSALEIPASNSPTTEAIINTPQSPWEVADVIREGECGSVELDLPSFGQMWDKSIKPAFTVLKKQKWWPEIR